MGNSNGTLAEYWDAIESTPGLQGGFIWEWWDHGLVQRLPDGTQRWAYGGDFGESPHDGNFVRRRPELAGSPAEAGDVGAQAPGRAGRACPATPASCWPASCGSRTARTSPISAGCARATSSRSTAWRSRAATSSCRRSARANAPRSASRVGRRRRSATAREAWLTIRLRTASELPWAPRGLRGLRAPAARSGAGPSARGDRRPLGDRAASSSTTEGRLRHPLLAAPPALSLWRAPTDNDRIGGMAATLGVGGARSPRAPACCRSTRDGRGHGRAQRGADRRRDPRSRTRSATRRWRTAACSSRRPWSSPRS